MSTSSRPVANEMIESILAKEPNTVRQHYEASSGLATPPGWLDQEWKVPKSGSETSFWKRAQELEVISDDGDAILFAQTKLSDSLDLIEVTHALFLELNAGYARLCPTDSAASMALAELTKTQRELKDAVAAYWDWKFILLGLEGPLPSYAGDFAAQLAQAKADSDPASAPWSLPFGT